MAPIIRQKRTFNSRKPGYTRPTSGATLSKGGSTTLQGPTEQDLFGNTEEMIASSLGVGKPKAISYNTLTSNPKPLSLQPTIPQTSAQGLEAYIGSSLESYNAQQEKEIKDLKKNQEGGQSAIVSLYDRLIGQGERSEDIYAQEGVDDARREADNLTSQIEAEQLSLRRRVETLRSQGGQNRSSLNDEVYRLERESLSKQADLGILQAAATRRYDTAAAIADRKIQMETEGLKTQLDALKFFYSENKAELSEKEDRQFQQLITQDERDYNEKFQAAKTLQDTKLEMLRSAAEQGAPMSVQQAIQSAITPEGALQAAGEYAGDRLDREVKRLQAEKLRAEITALAPTIPEGYQIGEIDSLEEIRNAPVSDITKAVMGGTIKLKDLTPTDKSVVAAELFAVGFNPYTYINNKLDDLVGTWKGVPDNYKGLIAGRFQPLASSRDKDVAEFESQKQVLTREVARLNDVGVLSDQDVAAYKSAMPSRGDASLDIVTSKIRGVKSSLETRFSGSEEQDEKSEEEDVIPPEGIIITN